MEELVKVSIAAMGPQYPELMSDSARILSVSASEEETFLATLKSGTQIFDTASAQIKKDKGTTLPGADIFKLHDTYGFPFDLTLEMAQEQGLRVDEDGFRRLMKEQRDRAKADSKAKKSGHTDLTQYRKIADESGANEFVGYTHQVVESIINGILIDGEISSNASTGDDVELVLNRTPFYAEGGGQLADGGLITFPDGSIVEIDDVQTPVPGIFVHRGRVTKGAIVQGSAVLAQIDQERRSAISRAHTATHMVHKAFREILGETATQAGSENSPGRFRFDFPAISAVPTSTLNDVEERVNSLLLEDLEVSAQSMSQNEAKKIGAMALFGEKYGDVVRVISVGDWARELCGGTHVTRSGQLGIVKLLGESSIGAGVRRVEALVGVDAYRFLAREHVLLNSLTQIIKGARTDELPERISDLIEKMRETEKELASFRSSQALAQVGALWANAKIVNGIHVVAAKVADDVAVEDLRVMALDLRNRSNESVVALVSIVAGKPLLVVAVSDSARTRGLKAGTLVKLGSQVLGGGGGGKDDFAQGGGTDKSKVDEMLLALTETIAG
ncbi:MAG: alanine--tRNA ligase-related protein [Actinobacteria bacterium]|nr:alanine--tRNA ligase-related protein [Actinomycetota bacterium]